MVRTARPPSAQLVLTGHSQFEASEGYRNDVSLVEQRRRRREAGATATSSPTFKARAEALNRMHLGDMAAFLFRSKD